MKAVTSTCNFIFEEEPVAGLLNNDQVCFSKIYDLYSGRLFGLIVKWVKEYRTAELILCEAFVKAWQDRNLFNAEAELFYCWLCRMARICYHEHSVNTSRKAL